MIDHDFEQEKHYHPENMKSDDNDHDCHADTGGESGCDHPSHYPSDDPEDTIHSKWNN